MSSVAETSAGDRLGSASDKVRTMAQRPGGRRVLIAIGSVVAAVALGVGLLFTDVFAVEQIDVSGNQRIDRSEVISKAGMKNAMPMISVDEGAIERRLTKDPWVESAVVKSEWPHKVSVAITERKPLLIAQTGDNKWAEIGAGGVVLSVADRPPAGLPVALNTTAQAQAGAVLDAPAQPLVAVAAAFPESLKDDVLQMQQDDRGVRLGLKSGLVVLVGSTEDLGAKLTAAASVARTIDAKTVETLDVTSPAMPVTTPKQKISPTTTVAPGKASTTEKSQASTNKNTQPKASING